jgi:hypothetical protein
VDECEKASGEFVKSGEDAPIVLHEAKHHLDFVALFVERPVSVALDLAVGFGRNDRNRAPGLNRRQDGVGIIGFVGDDGLGFDVVKQPIGLGRIPGLAGA